MKKLKDQKAEPWTYQDGVIFKAWLVKESKTGKAYLLDVYMSLSKVIKTFWVPKSQVDFEEGNVWLPDWLLKSKDISPTEGDPESNFPGKEEIEKTKSIDKE